MQGNAQKIHRIELPVPYSVRTINVYLVDEDPITLIDSGLRTDASFQVLTDHLRKLGYGIPDIKRILVTHGHPDHYGQAKGIAALSGAKVYIHREEFQRIRSLAQYRKQVASVLARNGIPKDSLENIIDYMRSTQHLAEPLDDVTFVSEGDEICFESMVFRAIHCPGHSPGLLCFYLEEEGILISGDHLLKEITPNPIINPLGTGPGPQSTSLKQYLHSIGKIKDLKVSLVLPGHGEPIRDFKAILEKILYHHEQRLAMVLSILSRGEKTAYEISQALFPDTKLYEVFLGISEVLGHLSILFEEEKIVFNSRNGIDYYSINSIQS